MDVASIFGAANQIRLLRQVLIFISLILGLYTYSVYANRINDKIYLDVQSNHFCSRRLNSTHQMGCSSELGGNVGIVWIVEDQKDLDHLLKTGPTPPYIAILQREYYTRKILLEFKANPDRVTGVVLVEDPSKATRPEAPFSPDDVCPNRYSGLYINDTNYDGCKQNNWQQESSVSGLLFDDIPYPIFFINEKESINEIESCFENNNIVNGLKKMQDTYPLCAMQLDSFMTAAIDTKTCLNSHSFVDELLQTNGLRCYPVGNQNVVAYYKPAFGPLHPVEKSTLMKPDIIAPQTLVVLTAKLSSLSMFTEISPGADSAITSIVTLLAIAEALGRIRNNSEVVKSKRNIIFALLDSEPFDYSGSSRMVIDMQDNSFPRKYFRSRDGANGTADAQQNINLESIDYVINLDQLASQYSKIHLHTDPLNRNDKKLGHVIDILNRNAESEKVEFQAQSDSKLPLPPTSVHQFIKQSRTNPAEKKLLGLVLSNYGEKYTNLYYHSIYDTKSNIYKDSKDKLIDHLTRTASFVAKSLHQLTFEVDKSESLVIDRSLVADLLECYLTDASCGLFTKAWEAGQQLPGGPIQTYKDPTKRSDDMNGAITDHLLAYFVGDRIPEYNHTQCFQEFDSSLIYRGHYVNGKAEPIKDATSGICIRSQVLMTESGPTYEVTDGGIDVNDKYPAWSVSLNSIRSPARLFIKPSPIYQWCVFLLGVIVTIISYVIVYQLRGSISKFQIESETLAGTST